MVRSFKAIPQSEFESTVPPIVPMLDLVKKSTFQLQLIDMKNFLISFSLQLTLTCDFLLFLLLCLCIFLLLLNNILA